MKTTAVVFENDRSGFGKRPQSFLETSAVVSEMVPLFLPLEQKKRRKTCISGKKAVSLQYKSTQCKLDRLQ